MVCAPARDVAAAIPRSRSRPDPGRTRAGRAAGPRSCSPPPPGSRCPGRPPGCTARGSSGRIPHPGPAPAPARGRAPARRGPPARGRAGLVLDEPIAAVDGEVELAGEALLGGRPRRPDRQVAGFELPNREPRGFEHGDLHRRSSRACGLHTNPRSAGCPRSSLGCGFARYPCYRWRMHPAPAFLS